MWRKANFQTIRDKLRIFSEKFIVTYNTNSDIDNL